MDRQYTKEADLLEAVMKWLEPQQCNGIKALKIRDRYAKGYSDLFICVKGRFVVAELKDDKGTTTPHQEQFIKEMVKAGAIGGVCRSVKDVAELIHKALTENVRSCYNCFFFTFNTTEPQRTGYCTINNKFYFVNELSNCPLWRLKGAEK